MSNESPTACVLIIGNEILSGKTEDRNLQFLGAELALRGVRLAEARVLPDIRDEVVAALNECRARYTYVITTGGIGPTHDDITAECVAAAFGRELVVDEAAAACLRRGGRELNPARLKMARVPLGAGLIDNPLSNAPGFRLENVFVLAGIPGVARAMFATFADELASGNTIHAGSVDVFLRESDIAQPLADIASAHPEVEIGSYPFSRDNRYGANLVVRGLDEAAIEAVMELIVAAMREVGGDSSIGERR